MIDKKPTGVLAFIEYSSRVGIPVEEKHFSTIERFRQKYFSDGAAVSEAIKSMGAKAFWLHYNSLVLSEVLGYKPEDELVETLTATFAKEYRPEVFMFDDVRSTLKSLKEKGIPMGIITTRAAGVDLGLNLGKVEQELEALGVADYFSFIIGVSPSGETKPHPSVFREAADSASVDISELLHVGNDFYADYQGALASGAQAALLDRHTLFSDVANRIENMEDILSFWVDEPVQA
ncbi:MAG: HAD hydrolase-like protein [Candidatus Obscuribacterales bacterium]|nr:HAD hydrolase-like protein [Candidatus Obscuribacterales bacterium]